MIDDSAEISILKMNVLSQPIRASFGLTILDEEDEEFFLLCSTVDENGSQQARPMRRSPVNYRL